MPETLTRAALNRALLARQLLLERAPLGPAAAVTHLVGMQAQIPNPPYIGLWTRLAAFARADLTDLMERRAVVRAALMRSTLHLMSAADYVRFRRTLEPALVKGLRSFYGKTLPGLDLAALVARARPFLAESPRSTGELGTFLQAHFPDRDPNGLAYIVRTYLPQVQVPPGGTWGSGSAGTYAPAEDYLGAPVQEQNAIAALFHRYLAAYGPASIMDFQTWVGITSLKEALAGQAQELPIFQDEEGRELYDLPAAPRPPADTPAPVRFLPEYDNILIAHDDRTRLLPAAFRPRVFLSAGRVRSTIVVDGFVRGAWKIEKDKKAATLVIEPFAPLAAATVAALEEEGARLLRWVEERATAYAIRFAPVE